jgi:hypothetical protein
MLSQYYHASTNSGDTDGTADGLEGTDAPAAPIDDYLCQWH